MENNSEKALKVSGFVSAVLLILTVAYFYLFAHTEDLDGYIYLGQYYYGEIDGMVSLLCFSVINAFLTILYLIIKNVQKELNDTGSVLKYTSSAVILVFVAITFFSVILLTYIVDDLDEYTQFLPFLVYVLSIICSAFVIIANKSGRENNAESENIKCTEIDNSLPRIQPETDSENKGKWHFGNDDKYGLKTELLYVCSPERFLKPYDSLRVGKAIELYKQIRAINPDDIEALSAVRLVAEQELDVRLEVEAFYEHLIDVFSPAPYVKNYNAEQLEKHHAICTQFTENKDDITALEQTLKMLLTENTEKVGNAKEDTSITGWVVCIVILTVAIILFIVSVVSI